MQEQEKKDKEELSNRSNQILPSDRVLQLRKELEELDNKLLSTKTINFQEIRGNLQQSQNNPLRASQYENDQFSDEEEDYHNRIHSQTKFDLSQLQNYEIEDELMRQSQGLQRISSSLKQSTTGLMNSSIQQNKGRNENLSNDKSPQKQPKYHLSLKLDALQDRVNQNIGNTTYLSHEGEVSFDLEKIYQKRNLNIKTAFESNLQEKSDLISQIESKINNIKKDSNAKSLKLAHLKYERDNIISQMKIEGIKKQEQQKEANEHFKRIDIKRQEDERAFNLAQNEIK